MKTTQSKSPEEAAAFDAFIANETPKGRDIFKNEEVIAAFDVFASALVRQDEACVIFLQLLSTLWKQNPDSESLA